MSTELSVAYTLRKHESEVTASKIVAQKGYFPVLISGDRDGLVLVWDLITRRSISTYRLESKAQISSINFVDQYVTVLSKDHCLRFFRLRNECSTVSPTTRKGTTSGNSCNLKEVYSIPVNTLNFANVAIQVLSENKYRLWCCNAENSECFDVYTFDLRDQQSLKREFKAVNLYSNLTDASNWNRSFTLDKTGIAMCFLELAGLVYIGFECGFVVGLRFVEHKDASRPSLEIVYASSVHYPEPVLSLCASCDGQTAYSSSTTSTVGRHIVPETGNCDIDDGCNTQTNGIRYRKGFALCNSSLDLETNEIAHIESVGHSLVALNWKGQTVVANKDETHVVGSKLRSNLLVDDSNVGSFSADKKPKNWIKASSVACLGKQVITEDQFSSVGHRRRATQVAIRNWTFTGYEDGSIVMQAFAL
ncbi:LAME_0E06348g1_1 [Lachancea meyersii CBS 8951]|uniref:ASTRA-associated protein 1 n=1 Tax=Lachancea meyersii CBS 8951 TaxID=1266667 RepID=A0A1G4JHS9_9SACH|nr:LAME_0E06348g1_1 [Lachancea meyersii CBS 8951]